MRRDKFQSIFRYFLLACLFAFSFATKTYSATFYIDSATGNDTRTAEQAQSQSNPWAHMPGMSGCTSNCSTYSVQPGDIFVLKGGSKWTFSSTTANLINVLSSNVTIMGGQQLSTPWGPGFPVLDGTGSTSTRHAIYSYGKSDLTIDGIKIFNIGYPAEANGSGILITDGGNHVIRNCWLETNSITGFHYGINGSGKYYSKLYFYNNRVRNVGRITIQVGDNTIDDVQLFNNIYEGPGSYNPLTYHMDGLMIGGDRKTTAYAVTNLKIFNNKFYGDWHRGATALIYLNGSPGTYSTSHTMIFNNIFATENNAGPAGGTFSPGTIAVYNGLHSDVKIYNNTISTDSCTAPPVSHCIFLSGLTGAEVMNNILSGCDNGVSISSGTSGVIIDYNLYKTVGGNHLITDWIKSVRCNTLTECKDTAKMPPLGYEVYNQTASPADPKFVAWPSGGVTGSGDWHLQATSPAIGKGVNLSRYFTNDYEGKSRGTTWDIGAYQYATTVSLQEPPTNLTSVTNPPTPIMSNILSTRQDIYRSKRKLLSR